MFLSLGFIATSSLGLVWSLEFRPSYSLHFNSAEGIRALHIGLRAWAATSVTLLFAFTTPIAQVSRLLIKMRTPTLLVDLMNLTYYSLFRLDTAYGKLVLAQRQRLGYRNFAVSLRSTGQGISAIFVRSVHQSILWERGLSARGYRGQLRVLLPPSEARFRHYVGALSVVLGIFILTILVRK
jgi:cobalt/nickel transport system permease protein